MRKQKSQKSQKSNVHTIRLTSGLNQTKFWGRIGVTQSAGSRYETGRNIPPPVRLLLDLVYGTPQVKAATYHKLTAPLTLPPTPESTSTTPATQQVADVVTQGDTATA